MTNDNNQDSKLQSEFEGPHAYALPDTKIFPDQELTFVELCYGILFQPKETFSRIAQKPQVFYAFLIIIGVNVIQSLVDVIIGIPSSLAQIEQMPGAIPGQMQSFLKVVSQPSFATLLGALGLALGIFWWFMLSAIFQLLAELFGGKGKGLGVLSVTGASILPQVLLIPIQVIIYALNWPQLIATILTIIIGVYTYIVLPIIGISRVHMFGTGRSIATVLTPYGVVFFGSLFFLGAIVAMFSIMLPVLEGAF
ncbi:MAG: YIP1 family protein [Carboxydocellales bacterium]